MNSSVEMRKIKILWFGTPKISAEVLELLIKDGFNIIGVVAQEDKPVGRKNEILPVPTKVIAQKYDIPVYQPHKIRLDFDFVKEIKPDLILTLAYGQIMPHDLLEIPFYKALNLHGSLLPKYRGAAPMQYALLNGDSETGITLMEMVDEMDAGRMFHKEVVKLDDLDNMDSLTNKMIDAAFKAVVNGLQSYLDGTNVGEEQNIADVTFTSKIKPEDSLLKFDGGATIIHNKIRALNPEPGCYFVYKGINYKVNQSIVISKSNNIGEIVSYDKNGLVIGCGNDSICFKVIQKPGKKFLNVQDFFNGNRDLFIVGENISDE